MLPSTWFLFCTEGEEDPLATRIYRKVLITTCEVVLLGDVDRIPSAPIPVPEVESGPGLLAVTTRCPDYGKVELEVWAGDPGPAPSGWIEVFDGTVETGAGGFDVGTSTAVVFHINAPAGSYRVRADALRDDQKPWFRAVRFTFAESPDLRGQALY
jgi:hypothetical protein